QLAAHTQQLQQQLASATSPVSVGYYGPSNGIGSSNGVSMTPNGCIGSNGYINNNCIMNGAAELNVSPGGCNMSSYTNGQHVVGPFKTYSNPDTLICGNCRELFTDLTELLDHKRSYCKLRFTCKCLSSSPVQKVLPSAKLVCVACKDSFSNPWDLMVHAQAAHMVNIYELGEVSATDDKHNGSAATIMSGPVSDRTANSTPTMPCSPTVPMETQGRQANGSVAGSPLVGSIGASMTNGAGVHETDEDKHDHVE
uniref:Uncharacterized protein n=1 Tax=Anopheles albimanus TaxID=7167 RepID=A0A182FDU2_ANOAL